MLSLFSVKNPEIAIAQRTAEILNSQLQARNVLWLLAGGSAKNYYEHVGKLLDGELDFTKLTISLGDERYDINPNHNTATWPELEKLDVFKMLQDKGAKVFQILSGGTIEVETERFHSLLEKELQQESYVLANQGIGADGHTAGIIPIEDKESFKETYLNKGYVVGHAKGGEHPNRVTISPSMLLRADGILAYAVGDDKKPALKMIFDTDKHFPETEWSENLHLAPALYMTVKNAEIYTDQEIS